MSSEGPEEPTKNLDYEVHGISDLRITGSFPK